MKVWSSETPYLYEVQVGFIDDDDTILDANTRTFGMRKFHMDEASQPKGKLYLNNQEIHLRGANTMGFEQHDVMRGELDQLVDDILLAKIAHMNFWRITQRPVQETVYDYCDHLGLMTQTDLPAIRCSSP
jgi:beta-galactosidase/beta-glucuronidase